MSGEPPGRLQDAILLPSGLRYYRLIPGHGPQARRGDEVAIHYRIRSAADGRVYDSSFVRQQPLTLRLGDPEVMRGIEEGTLGMQEGERRRLLVPAHLAYRTVRDTPPTLLHEALVIDVVLLRIAASEPALANP